MATRDTFVITVDNKDLLNGLREAEAAYTRLRNTAHTSTTGLNRSIDGTSESFNKASKSGVGFWQIAGGGAVAGLAIQALSGLAAGLKAVATSAVKGAADYEKLKISFTTFLGSAKEADIVLGKLTEFANVTPYEPDEVNKSAKALLAFGVASNDLIPTLTKIGDIAAATGKDFSELAVIYGKAKVAGTLYAEDINQLTEAGIPVIQEFAKQLGVSESQVKKLGSEGKISFSNLEQAFTDLTKEGSKFGGLMEAQSASLEGVLSNLKGNFDLLAREMGEEMLPVLKAIAEAVGDFLGSLDSGTIMAYFSPIKDNLLPVLKELYDAWVGVFSAITGMDFSDSTDGVGFLNQAFLVLVDAMTLCTRAVTAVVKALQWFLELKPVQVILDAFRDQFRQLGEAISWVSGLFGDNAEKVQKQNVATAKATKATKELTSGISEQTDKQKKSNAATANATKASEDNKKAIEARKRAIEALNKAYDDLNDRLVKSKLGQLTGVFKIEEEARLALIEIDELEKGLVKMANNAGRALSKEAIAGLQVLRDNINKDKLREIAVYYAAQRKELQEQEKAVIQTLIDGDEKVAKAREETQRKSVEAAQKALAAKQKGLDDDENIENLKIDLIRESGNKILTLDEYKEVERLKVQIEFAKKRLSLIQNDPASAKEAEIIRLQIQNYQKTIEEVGKGSNKEGKGLKGILSEGLGISEDQFDEVLGGFEAMYSKLADMAAAATEQQINENQRYLDDLAERKDTVQSQLEEELRLQAKGYANNVRAKRDELNQITIAEREAVNKQRELEKQRLRQQLTADSIEQGSNVITMASKSIAAYAEIPFAGILLAAAAITGFIALLAGIKAKQKQISSLAEGGALSQTLSGPTDKQGQQGYHVTDSEGNVVMRLGGDEYVMNAMASSKYRPILDAMNRNIYPLSPVMGREAAKHGIAQSSGLTKEHIKEVFVEYMTADHNFWKNKPERVPLSDGYLEITPTTRRKIKTTLI